MSDVGINHKLRVFISSKCGDKYSIARKALQKLLESTGLLEVYVFENEPASSEDTQSSYLDYVDNSNLCIFLIDNADGVPAAVLSEEKRAKDKNLRLIYLFCDENKKEATPMQEEIKNALSQKYCVVHEFSDIVPKAYDSVMQDVIDVYKKNNVQCNEPQDEKRIPATQSINTKPLLLSSSCFSGFSLLGKLLSKRALMLSNAEDFEQEGSSLEQVLLQQLKFVILEKSFDNEVIDRISTEVEKECDKSMFAVLKLRYDAQKHYYSAKYKQCLSKLQKAIKLSLSNSSIPTWLANDIAIDIRLVQELIDENNSQITINNPGQKYLEKSIEPVFFPYLDRQVEIMNDEIIEKYDTQLNISPYTTTFGGSSQVFSSLANAFCVAEMHGSILQTEITRERLISIYSMLCNLYDNHDYTVEYICLNILNRKGKNLDTIIRTYNQSADILNGKDIDAIICRINNIPDPVHRIMAKYLITGRFGYYMTDSTFSLLYDELVKYALNWIRDEKRVFNMHTYILEFFKETTHRAKIKDVIDFVYAIFTKNFSRYYSDCFRILYNIDFTKLNKTEGNRIKRLFIRVLTKVDIRILDHSFTKALIRFCRSASVPCEDLDKLIESKMPEFYKDVYLLELSEQRNIDLSDFVISRINSAKQRNKTQGLNGVYSDYANECLDIIYNIVCDKPDVLKGKLLRQIIDVSIETLAAPKQTIRAKIAAISLLQLVYYKSYKRRRIWKTVIPDLMENRSSYSTGVEMNVFSKDTNQLLSFQYSLFMSEFDTSESCIVINKLYSSDASDSYNVIQILRILCCFLEETKAHHQTDNLIAACQYYCIFMSQHRERDVRYNASRCLIELTNYDCSKHLSLVNLSQIMNMGSQAEKIAILTRVKKIAPDDDSYIEQIINKGKSDSNYLVRYIASRE